MRKTTLARGDSPSYTSPMLGGWAYAMAVVLAPTSSPYEVSWGEDAAATAAALSVSALLEAAVKPSLGQAPDCRHVVDGHCDAADLNAIDRTVVGNHSSAWGRVSDVGEISGIAVPLLAAAIDSYRHDGPRWSREAMADTLVIAESLAVANLATTALKMAVRRPRPSQYGPDEASPSVERSVSFPSGHTTAAAAGSVAYAMTFALRYPESSSRFAVFAAAAALTAMTGYGRVGAGMHFYSDVVAGAIIGGAIGYLVPRWHRTRTPASPLVSAAPLGNGVGLQLVATF
ncbi:MAG: phosphatase PAP2 family protein [Myxococcota bacterium]